MVELRPREARRRAALYVIIPLVLAAGSWLLTRVEWRSGPDLHTLQEVVATLLAAIVGTLSLVRYYSRKEQLFLVIGAAFLGTAALDAFHAVVTLPVLMRRAGEQATAMQVWSWFASRTYLGLLLVRLSIVPRRKRVSGGLLQATESTVYGTLVLLALTSALALIFVPLPTAYRLAPMVERRQEAIPAALFLIAALLNLRSRGWRTNAFEHWLVLSLLIACASHALFMIVSKELYDPWFDAAHLLKNVSYLCVLVGLLMSVYFTYRQVEESHGALVASNEALQHEVLEHQATERELQIRTAYLEQLFESAPEGIAVVDSDDRVLRVNAEFSRLFGYDPMEVAGRTINSLIVPEAELNTAESLTRAVAHGETVAFEGRRRRRDGSIVDVSVLGTPIRGTEGQIAVYGIYRDITDRKRAEEELRVTAERLEATISAAPVAILTLDPAGRIGMWNPAAERMFGWSAHEVMGGPPPFVPASDTPRARELFARAFQGVVLADVQIERRTRAGDPVQVSLSSAPLKAADGSTSGVLLVLADVTERRRAQEELIQAKAAAESANRAKSDFLASMSHELRTPLNSVIGFTRVLMRNKAGNLTAPDTLYLDRIAANGQHLLGLINDILDLSKIEAGKMEVERVPVRLGELVRDTVAQLEVRTFNSDVQLVAELPDTLEEIDSDPNKLRQVLINLIGNAIKFTPTGGVRVRVVTRDGSTVPARIEVIDSGIGIAPERLAHIFDAFEQAERSTSRRYGGTGLGLSISRGLCRMLGYELTVKSRVGLGSTFIIDLDGPPAPRQGPD